MWHQYRPTAERQHLYQCYRLYNSRSRSGSPLFCVVWWNLPHTIYFWSSRILTIDHQSKKEPYAALHAIGMLHAAADLNQISMIDFHFAKEQKWPAADANAGGRKKKARAKDPRMDITMGNVWEPLISPKRVTRILPRHLLSIARRRTWQ